MDKRELINKIRSIEGLNNDEKSALIELLRKQKKYGLVWEDKPEDVEERLRNELPVLKEVKERAIISEDKDAPNHILIEGDNLEALTALSYTHKGKIDVIYIDPPYNTGEKNQFKYNDSWVDSEDTYRHSKWLSFMKKRITLSKDLLKDDGLLFISIDDHELCQLKMLCDEIFETNNNPKNSNMLGILVWDLGTGTSAGHFTRSHEYILCYTINKKVLPNFDGGTGYIDDRAIKKESSKNKKFEYKFKKGIRIKSDHNFELAGTWGGKEQTTLVEGHFRCKNGVLDEDCTLSSCWTQKNQMDSFFDGEYTVDSKGQHVAEFYFRDNGKLYCIKEKGKINPPSVLRGLCSTKAGSALLNEIMSNSSENFAFPKPIELISFLASLKDNNIKILDFFAGSGTTLHAAMKLNSEDGGHRQCILVTNNENKICEDVTYIRNKKVIEGYTTPKGVEVAGLKSNSLRYYKTDFISRDQTPRNMRALVSASTDLLCIKNDIYTEALFAGKHLNAKIARYFDDGKQRMLVIYDERAIAAIVEMIKDMPTKPQIKVYTFAPSRYAFDDEFVEVVDKVTLCALPAAIYDAYQRVLPKRRPQYLPEALAEMNKDVEQAVHNEPAQSELDFNEEGGEE